MRTTQPLTTTLLTKQADCLSPTVRKHNEIHNMSITYILKRERETNKETNKKKMKDFTAADK